ncbi:hypothetical protein GCM10009744_02510 [Kribbella alba]|uniref:Uncharacterized protein n=1 Tax=Kribbella alba TaxID=190197 RepID=A0ABN2EVH9_9ACTN
MSIKEVRSPPASRAEAVNVDDAHDALAIGGELINILTPVVDKILSAPK